jgi:pyruvate/2-oxoglutarate dehydrogenase complex dihydrolipoamide dehydrogenase (E3) component
MTDPGRVLVLGGGSTGEAFVGALRRLGCEAPITLVERGLIGGECTYYACMPTKGLLRPVEAVAAARAVPGAREAVTGRVDLAEVFRHRDQITDGWDDSGQEQWLREHATELVRGSGRVLRPGLVEAGDRELAYDTLVISTGSVPSVPPIAGLADVPYWTNRHAAAVSSLPASIAILGAGPVGCEFAQFFCRMGSRVVLLDAADRLLPRDVPEAGAVLARVFATEGVELRLGASVERVESRAGAIAVHAGGEPIRVERLLVATGRAPAVDGLGLEHLGVSVTPRGIEVDDQLRAAEGVWAIGDVNGIAMFTHAGKYQARVAARAAVGLDARADHRAVPAVTFTDPQVASVGETGGEGAVSATWKVEHTARASTYQRPKREGFVTVFADPERRVLVGATAVGPEAGEWLGQLTVAIVGRISVDVLRDTIQPYPTFSEAIFFALRDLPL